MSINSKATDLHNDGYNCAQSVFGACSDECGIDEKAALAIRARFGGGAGCGELCGAISGGIMAIGAAFANDDPHNSAKVKKLRGELIQKVRDKYGVITCRELKAPGKAVPCGDLIEGCAVLADEIINNNR